jgi:hypothetical protein
VEAENELPYCISKFGFLSCCLPFVFVFLHVCTNNCFHLIVNILYIQISSVFYLSLELSWCRVSFLKGDLQFSKFLKNTICIGLCKLKCTEERFIPFTPLHCLPEFVPHTEFKGRPEDAKWNVHNHTSFRNYAPFSLQVPSILSILLGHRYGKGTSVQLYMYILYNISMGIVHKISI